MLRLLIFGMSYIVTKQLREETFQDEECAGVFCSRRAMPNCNTGGGRGRRISSWSELIFKLSWWDVRNVNDVKSETRYVVCPNASCVLVVAKLTNGISPYSPIETINGWDVRREINVEVGGACH